ncbi:hypothetical protein [Salibacter halophilus]|uniref:DUF4760 domain-containing protein n=1 Tax=Salibacter halophilus TaxID=1803916 RepID=A0A6N6M9A2_9FLAO|nr:hypothetical protein [Salibacter halophilus]KAB1065079.1 hypothetical protein F3059_03765 [Salibacter halophilus]
MELGKIDKGIATLIAAGIAAVISIFTLMLTLFFNRKSEIRSARRKSLEEFIYDVADSVHQLIAISNILLKNKTPESRSNWTDKANKAKMKLKALRPKIRYALWGLDKPIKVLTRLPDYTQYTLESDEVSKKTVKRGSNLGDALDNCIRKCYLNGRSPRFYEIWWLRFLAWKCEKPRNEYKLERDKKLEKQS